MPALRLGSRQRLECRQEHFAGGIARGVVNVSQWAERSPGNADFAAEEVDVKSPTIHTRLGFVVFDKF